MPMSTTAFTEALTEGQRGAVQNAIDAGAFDSVTTIITKFTVEDRTNSAAYIYDRFINRDNPNAILREHRAFMYVWRMTAKESGRVSDKILALLTDREDECTLAENPRKAYLALTRQFTDLCGSKGIKLPERTNNSVEELPVPPIATGLTPAQKSANTRARNAGQPEPFPTVRGDEEPY